MYNSLFYWIISYNLFLKLSINYNFIIKFYHNDYIKECINVKLWLKLILLAKHIMCLIEEERAI